MVDLLDVKGTLKLLAKSCALLDRDESSVRLALDARSESFLTRDRETGLAEALSKYFGKPLKVSIALQGERAEQDFETPLQKEERQEDERLEAARRSLDDDPNVVAMKEMFGAEMSRNSVELVKPDSNKEQS